MVEPSVFFSTDADFLPHGTCLAWKRQLLWLHAGSDAAIALAYYSIPLALVYYALRRQDLQYRWMFALFAAYILACGTSHLLDLLTLWYPLYMLQGVTKLVTALASTATAAILWWVIPKALEIPTRAELSATNLKLQHEVLEHRRTEALLRDSEERFRTMADSSPVMIWVSDASFGCIYFNASWLSFSGRSLLQESGFGWCEGLHPEDRTQVIENYKEAVASKQTFMLEYRLRRADGEYRWVWDSGAPRFSPQGELLGYIGTAFDITDRKRAELGLSKAKLFLESVVENIPDTVIVKDAKELRYISINHAGEALLGYSREELAGKTDAELFSDECSMPLHQHDQSALNNSSVFEIPEEHIISRLGEKKLVHSKRIILSDDAGRPSYLLAIFADISAKKRAEEQLLQRQLELVHAQRIFTISELGAGLGHELNQPIGAITNYAEGALLRFQSLIVAHPTLGQVLNEIVRLAGHAGGIIRNLRKLVHKRDLGISTIDINQLTQDTARLLTDEFKKRQISVDLKLAPTAPTLQGNEVMLQQVLVNLTLNAMDAIEASGTDQREVLVSTEQLSASSVCIRVADHGAGIAPKVAERLFEPFVSTKVGGIGLGLSICRTIVEAHHGYICVRKDTDEATVFEVMLPACAERKLLPGDFALVGLDA